MRSTQVFERGDVFSELTEEGVGARRPYHLRPPQGDQPRRSLARLASDHPVGREAAARTALDRGAQRGVPVRRPAADDQAVLVEDLVEQAVERGRVGSQLGGRVEDPGVELVAVQLDERAGGVREGEHPRRGVGRGDDLRPDPGLL